MRGALIAGLILFSCGAACSSDADRALKDSPQPGGPAEWVPSDGAVERPLTPPALADRVVVFPAERASELLTQCSRRVPGPVQGTWPPDQAILARLEDALGPALSTAMARAGPHVPKQHSLDDYYRQYGGVVVGGQRIVYVNAFHGLALDFAARLRPARPVDWRHLAVNACGGGTEFFGAEFEVGSGKIAALVFNGPS